jgi:nitrogen fixation NifU-like protein
MYAERLLDHFQNPRNAGELKEPAWAVEVSNPACGDILRLYVDVQEGRIARVSFKARGCTASIACGSALTELMLGKTFPEAEKITTADVEREVGGLIAESKHAAVLAQDGLKAALKRWRK